MKSKTVLTLLITFACLGGCRSNDNASIPEPLLGTWKTSASSYEDNFFELGKAALILGTGKASNTVNCIFQVEEIRSSKTSTLYVIHYMPQENNEEYILAFYYDATGGGTIRFKNQMQIQWKLVQHGAGGSGSFTPCARPGLWRRHSNLNLAVALLGVALVAGGTAWRLRRTAVGRAGQASSAQADSAPGAELHRRAAGTPLGGQSGDASWSSFGNKEGVDWSQAPTRLPEFAAQKHRRSERILLTIPVRVTGSDVNGTSFEESTFTLSIDRNGAFLCLRNTVRSGDQITVTNIGTRQSSPFRVCESGGLLSDGLTAWGVECLDPAPNFWQISFPDKPPAASPPPNIVNALVECAVCESRELTELSVPQFREILERDLVMRDCSTCRAATQWRFRFIEPSAEGTDAATLEADTKTAAAPTGEENRREKRILAKLPIRIKRPADGGVENTVTENVSKFGVCCAASMELSVGEQVFVTFESGGKANDMGSAGRTMWRRPLGEKRQILYGIKLEVEEF